MNTTRSCLFKCVILACLLLLASCGSKEETIVGPPLSPPVDRDLLPAWSPTRAEIVFVREHYDSVSDIFQQSLWIVNPWTGDPDSVTDVTGLGLHSISWSPDGDYLLFAAPTGIFKMGRDGDSIHQLISGEFHVSPTWSRVSNRIFYSVLGGAEMGLYSMTPDGSEVTRWTMPGDSIVFSIPSCFSDSDTLVGRTHRSADLCLALYYPGDSTLADTLVCGYSWLWTARSSANHRFVAFNTTEGSGSGKLGLYLLDRNEGQVTLVDSVESEGLDVSPDGSMIVYTDLSISGGLKIYDIGTKEYRQLTRGLTEE